MPIDAEVIGINNRDLSDFSVDTARTNELITDVPAGKTVVSESGYESHYQLAELERIGVDAVLIGEALMRSDDPEALVRELTRDEEATREHYLERASEENPAPARASVAAEPLSSYAPFSGRFPCVQRRGRSSPRWTASSLHAHPVRLGPPRRRSSSPLSA